ncbi:MAG: DUF502 domain-containing protein [Planctomycetes bacterium]|nr:DUF502 domain-containing protein [Planctomycetota bacterium]
MTTTQSERTFTADFKRFFIRGLVVLLPTVLTLWIIVQAYRFVDKTIADPINDGLKAGLVQLTSVWPPLQLAFDPSEKRVNEEVATRIAMRFGVDAPQKVREDLRAENIRLWWDDRWYMHFIGLIAAIVAVYIAGRLLGGFLGRRIYRKLEGAITTVPVVKQVYPYVKQIVDFLFSDERPQKFSRVVIVQYPRKGIWSVGFLTGNAMKSIVRESGDAVTVFIPSSPTPFTGYTIVVKRREVIEIPLTVEEAIRYAVSAGVLVPDQQLIEDAIEPAIDTQEVTDPPRRPETTPARTTDT